MAKPERSAELYHANCNSHLTDNLRPTSETEQYFSQSLPSYLFSLIIELVITEIAKGCNIGVRWTLAVHLKQRADVT